MKRRQKKRTKPIEEIEPRHEVSLGDFWYLALNKI
jgi:hypothetical protein